MFVCITKNEIHDIGILDLHCLVEQLCQLTYLRQWPIKPKSHLVTFECYYHCCELLIVCLQIIVLLGANPCQRRLTFRYSLFIDIKFGKKKWLCIIRYKTSSTEREREIRLFNFWNNDQALVYFLSKTDERIFLLLLSWLQLFIKIYKNMHI